MKKVFFYVLAAFMLTSCSTTATFMDHYSSRTVPIDRDIIAQTPMIADLNVNHNDKVKFSTTVKSKVALPGIKYLKELTLYRAMKELSVDVIVDPVFEIVKDGSKYECSVSGFKGSYTNFRKASEDEIDNLKDFYSIPFPFDEEENSTTSFGIFSQKKK